MGSEPKEGSGNVLKDLFGVDGKSSNVSAGISPASTDRSGSAKNLLSNVLPTDNALFTGGLSLMVIGGTLALGRKALVSTAELAQRRLLVSLEIPSRDKAHPWFLAWMSAQAQQQTARAGGRFGKEPSRLRALLSRSHEVAIISHDLAVETTLRGPGSTTRAAQLGDMIHSSDRMAHVRSIDQKGTHGSGGASRSNDARFSLVPGPGTHYFRFRGVWMRLHRERADRLLDVTTGAPWETIKLTTLYSARHLLPELLAEARAVSVKDSEGKTVIYTAWGPDWRPFGQPRRPRELDSVVLHRGVKEELVNDVDTFMRSGTWYADRGIPYRRGYLLYGPPGSGKSSLISALAGYHNLNICLLSLSDRGMTDDKLLHLLANAPERSVLILEDIDVAFASRDANSSDADDVSGSRSGPAPTKTNITFSGLLNALDGVASSEERIVFMTTNYPERLDPALVRPGRVDRAFELGDADEEQVHRMMRRFYARDQDTASADEETYARFAKLVAAESERRREALGLDRATGRPINPSALAALRDWKLGRGGVSMAEVQGWFIREPESAAKACDAWEQECNRRWKTQKNNA
ncbi:Complex III assembly protein translocase and chaperone [Tilletia horrida]|uniref:Complex III assembly protein translocase and chaperone n=1 Tax=Tilletia horrida TaxID=155126 RepID=A0AAN6JRG3_9BASI|nr:Complex III assembly protein translocase and chaperone [Tilletia horrida]KAK0550256.1 Complex III assembly protein translocase and chaperone [Tilletia horrida]KAK0565402.1 Complex III assembly protein translocase and chaperone [Tilletia horrida]